MCRVYVEALSSEYPIVTTHLPHDILIMKELLHQHLEIAVHVRAMPILNLNHTIDLAKIDTNEKEKAGNKYLRTSTIKHQTLLL